MEFEIYISYQSKPYNLKVDLYYESNQVMRYRVYGMKESIVIQNNWPLLVCTNKQRTKVAWKLIEGKMRDAHLLSDIIIALERNLNHDKYYKHV